MATSLTNRAIKRIWNIFSSPRSPSDFQNGLGTYYRPDRVRKTYANAKTTINAICNRIALDVADAVIEHVRLDETGRYLETIQSDLNNCFCLEANLDQTSVAFKQDIVMSMLDEGAIAVVPVYTDNNIYTTDSYKIYSLRVGRITEWFPDKVRVSIYNEETGKRQEVIVEKRAAAIIENPFYSVMNEPNSTVQRLNRKLALLDAVDEQSSSGKLDLIIQLPYVVKGETRKAQAERRRVELENQLTGSKYGVAYTDGTEKITQLNRPIENNLMKQVEYLTNLLFSEMGMTPEILNGTADEKTMTNYKSRIIGTILNTIVEEFRRKFLTTTARSQRQSIIYYLDPFKFIPPSVLPDYADKLTRNEIVTTNEIRQAIGMRPSTDPNADILRNKNLNAPAEMMMPIEQEPFPEEINNNVEMEEPMTYGEQGL